MMHKDKIVGRHCVLPYHYHKAPVTPVGYARQVIVTCPECGFVVALDDYVHSVLSCKSCGLVLGDYSVEVSGYGGYDTNKLYTGSRLTRSEYEFFKSRRRKHGLPHFVDSVERNKQYYYDVISTVKYELALSKSDVEDVKYIINKAKTLKKLHSRLNAETIIVAICRFVKKEYNNVKPQLLRFKNKIYREYKLNRKDYNIIEKNIKRII